MNLLGNKLKLMLGVAFSSGLLILAVPGSGIAQKWNGLRETSVILLSVKGAWFLPVLAGVLAYCWSKAYRWKLLLSAVSDLRTTQMFPPTVIGLMANNMLPLHGGELVRTCVLGSRYGLSKSAVLMSIFLERILDMISVLLFLGLTALMLDIPIVLRRFGLAVSTGSLILLSGLIFYAYRTELVVKWCQIALSRFPNAAFRFLYTCLKNGADGLGSIKKPWLFLKLLAISLIICLNLGVLVYLSLRAFSIHVPFEAVFLVLALGAFAVIIPTVPGYWGALEMSFCVALVNTFGVADKSVLAASIYYHATQYFPITIAGLIYFYKLGLGLNFSDILSEHKG